MAPGKALVVIAAAACSFMLSASCAGTAAQGSGRPAAYPLPEIKKDCSGCHTPEGSKSGELKKALSQLCLDCHQDRTAPAEHRVDIVPKREVEDLPLFGGRIACATCHDVHRNTHGSLLRMPARKLCFACHPV
ncbi:MAG: cytochrome c3 family protein [Nitrospirota bacterium]